MSYSFVMSLQMFYDSRTTKTFSSYEQGSRNNAETDPPHSTETQFVGIHVDPTNVIKRATELDDWLSIR